MAPVSLPLCASGVFVVPNSPTKCALTLSAWLPLTGRSCPSVLSTALFSVLWFSLHSLAFVKRRLAFDDQPTQHPLLLSAANQSQPRLVRLSVFSPLYSGALVVGYLSWEVLTNSTHAWES